MEMMHRKSPLISATLTPFAHKCLERLARQYGLPKSRILSAALFRMAADDAAAYHEQDVTLEMLTIQAVTNSRIEGDPAERFAPESPDPIRHIQFEAAAGNSKPLLGGMDPAPGRMDMGDVCVTDDGKTRVEVTAEDRAAAAQAGRK